MKSAILAAALAVALGAHAFAQDPEPTAVMAMTMAEGALSGPGADAILARLPDAQFILVGEDHGFADSPEITLALARAARPFGLKHHVIEVGPFATQWLSGVLKSGEPDDLAALLDGRPLAFPFVNMREDAILADEIIDAGGSLWGVDQEFIGSPLLHLETLAARAKDPQAKAEIEALLAAEKTAFAAFDQSAMFLFTADAAAFDRLDAAFAKDKTALALVAALRESADIYQSYAQRKNYKSNADRVALIRRQLLAAYNGAREKTPRAIFKMGSNHVGLGSTTLNTFDLGSVTEGVAAANGLNVLRVAFYPLSGRNTQISPSPDGAFAQVDYRSDEIAAFLTAAGIAEDDIAQDGWSVIALAPLRLKLEQRAIEALAPEAKFLLLGYDFLITTRSALPATPLAE